MKMRFLITSMFLFGLVACKPERQPPPSAEAERYAAVVCEAAAECGCASWLAPHDACMTTLMSRFDEVRAQGLDIDEGCFAELLEALGEDPCGETMVTNPFEACPALFGEQREGQACTARVGFLPLIFANDCVEGVCYQGSCLVDGPRPFMDLGERCEGEHFTCSPPGYCSAAGYCAERQQLGEPCDPFGCIAEHYCEGGRPDRLGTCEPWIELGDACDPLDYMPCKWGTREVDGWTVTDLRWCDPTTNTCVERNAKVCNALNVVMLWQ